MTWSSGSSTGSGSGWGSPESDDGRPVVGAGPGPGGGAGSGSWGGGATGWSASAPPTGGGWDPPTPSPAGGAATQAATQSGPPWLWLVLGGVAPVVAAGLLVLTGPVVNGVGWALAAFGAVAFLGVFQAQDLSRRVSDWYAAQDRAVGVARVVVLVLAFVVAAFHAYFLAQWIGRLDVFA